MMKKLKKISNYATGGGDVEGGGDAAGGGTKGIENIKWVCIVGVEGLYRLSTE